jgi:membrane-bound inhibitor of C-type lysozyme
MSKLPLQLFQKGARGLSKYHSPEEIMGLYNDKDALFIIKDMIEKEIIRAIKSEQEIKSNDLVSASNAGYVTGIMWVKGELAKIEEVLKDNKIG